MGGKGFNVVSVVANGVIADELIIIEDAENMAIVKVLRLKP